MTSDAGFLEPIEYHDAAFVELYDELPLWSAPFVAMLLARVPLRRGEVIVDVGAGTGALAIELAERCGPPTRVIAIDPWEQAMARLARKAQARGVAIECHVQDAREMPLADHAAGLIVSNLGIHNFDDPAAVLRECHRVLRPGGELWLTTNLAGHMAEFCGAFEDTLRALGHHDRLPALAAHIARRGTAESITALLHETGFGACECEHESFVMRFADGSALLRHAFIRLGFVQGWRAVVAGLDEPRFFAALEARLNAAAEAAHGLTLSVPAACIRAKRLSA